MGHTLHECSHPSPKGQWASSLPCLVAGVFLLLRKEPFLRVCGKLIGAALASCLLPALWYYVAYLQAGKEFLDLIIEENFDRFTGNMSYSSHNAPPFYYLYITLAGFLPWTPAGCHLAVCPLL